MICLGQPVSGKQRKAKRLESSRSQKYSHRQSESNSGIISLPDGQGNTTPEFVNLKSNANNARGEPSIEH